MYSRVDNHQKFSTLRLIPSINQKNYFTNYLKKDSQYLCRKTRERPEPDYSRTVVLHLGSRYIRCGFNDDSEPLTLPFCVNKKQRLYTEVFDESSENCEQEEEEGWQECSKALAKRMHDAKIKVTTQTSMYASFNESQKKGESTKLESDLNFSQHKLKNAENKLFCLETEVQGFYNYWPLHRGVLNEDPAFYASVEELRTDIEDILRYIITNVLKIDNSSPSKNADSRMDTDTNMETNTDAMETDPPMNTEKNADDSIDNEVSGNAECYDIVLVVPDMFERKALDLFSESLFKTGFQNLAVIDESVAATYGAGVSAGCVVDIGAQTTTVSCVEEGMCVADSRVKLDFGSDDITRALGRALKEISFPGNPEFLDLDSIKQKFCTVNEYEITVQLGNYYKDGRKYDFKVYQEIAVPVFGLFYPSLFGLKDFTPWRHRLIPPSEDPYTEEPNDGISDADIDIRFNRLLIRNQTYRDLPQVRAPALHNAGQGEDNDEIEDDTHPNPAAAGDHTDLGEHTDLNDQEHGEQSEQDLQLNAYKSLDPAQAVHFPLDLAITESIAQARAHIVSGSGSGSTTLASASAAGAASYKQYYENLIVIGAGSKIPGLTNVLRDRLYACLRFQRAEVGEISVVAMPKDADVGTLCWRGGTVYSKLRIIDEMWTTSHEWSVLGSRSLYYKAALYSY